MDICVFLTISAAVFGEGVVALFRYANRAAEPVHTELTALDQTANRLGRQAESFGNILYREKAGEAGGQCRHHAASELERDAGEGSDRMLSRAACRPSSRARRKSEACIVGLPFVWPAGCAIPSIEGTGAS